MACVIAVCEIKDGFAFTFVMFLHGLTPAAHVKIIKICPPPIWPPKLRAQDRTFDKTPAGHGEGGGRTKKLNNLHPAGTEET